MGSCSKSHIGYLNEESYAERFNSIGNLLLTDSNSLLGGEETEMLVLCMNRYYMCFMLNHYGKHILKIQPFCATVVTVTNKT